MLALILGFAMADGRIRAVVMNGSRVNPNVTRDPFQDCDIVNFVTDVEPFRKTEYVVPRFGEAIVVEHPLIGPWSPADAGGSYHNYNMQLFDGTCRDDAGMGDRDTDGMGAIDRGQSQESGEQFASRCVE